MISINHDIIFCNHFICLSSIIPVVNVHDESQPVGSLGVTVWCVAALRAIQREVEASRAEEEEGEDIDTDEEA